MRKSAIRLAVAIPAFVIGVVLSTPWPEYKSGMNQERQHHPPEAAMKVNSVAPVGWRKIERIKFSLYLPPDLKEERSFFDILDFDRRVEDMDCYAGGGLWVWYICDKGSSCDPHPAMAFRYSAVEVSGRPAKLFDYYPGNKLMDLCVPDIGDGKTSLWLRAGGRNKLALNLARRVFDSIELK